MTTTSKSDNLYAERLTDGWSVVDPAGGRWWPSDEAQADIEAAEDPEQRALEICERETMRGEWHA